MRPLPLTVLKGGINRLKVKGGASAQQLYDLTNAYITQAGTVVPREGTIRAATLTSQSVGLAAFNGKFNVFSTSLVTVPTGYVDNLLIHPTNPAATLTKIWFAKPFLGFPYVVAQFSTGEIFHYWLQSNGTWAASTVYKTGAIITPLASPNGLAYQAVRDMKTNPTWSPQTATALGTLVEPNTYTGFAYRAVAVSGSTPHTGSTEPVWATTLGGIVQEFGDFSTSATAAGTTQATTVTTGGQPLGKNITDRYGNSAVISGNTGTSGNATSPSVPASETVTNWAPGTLYAPGAVVQPTTSQGAFINAIPNGDFEAGADGNWSLNGGWTINNDPTHAYQGSFCAEFPSTGTNLAEIVMFNFGTVTVGQTVSATGYLNPNNNGTDLTLELTLRWYSSTDVFISEVKSAPQQGGGYRQVSVSGTAPTGAAHARVAVWASTGTSSRNTGFADLITWNLETPSAVSNFLFEAVQAAPATSGTTEPTWPTVAGNTVIDNGVTWKAIGTSIITWQAIPIMQSGTVEPTWPTAIGNAVRDSSTYTSQDGHVTDTSMSWVTINRQVPTPNPGKAVILGASHVFNGDNDIVDYCAAVNPTDWTSTNNAGYLPTGLNNYGDNPVAALSLYRSNLMVFNAGGYQMWQIDPDPQNMALLDAQPIGSIYTRTWQAVANDAIGLTEVGVRNISTVGATANMQVGSTGQPVDPIVKARLVTGTYDPLSLYYPGRGQYWLIFGPEAIVMTINGAGQKTWSRYTFPDVITDWTLNGGILYLRSAGNLVWQFDYQTLQDDTATALAAPVQSATTTSTTGGTLAAATYFYKVTATNILGETTASNEQSIVTTGTTSSNTVSWAAVPGAAGYKVYRGTATGAENVFYTVGAVVSFLDTGAANTAGSPPVTNTTGGSNTSFTSTIQWPYLDSGVLGINKMLVGIDLVGYGAATIQVAYQQADVTTFSDHVGFSTSTNVTAPYTVSIVDTVPGQPLPIPVNAPSYSIILAFSSNQPGLAAPNSPSWEWEGANMYVTDQSGGGATG